MTEKETKVVKAFYYIVGGIIGNRERYSINVIHNYDYELLIQVMNNSTNEIIFNHSIINTSVNQMEIINKLRNIFIMYGATLSVLVENGSIDNFRYGKQIIYSKNLTMNIDINSKNNDEVMNTMIAHRNIINPTKSDIQYNKILKAVSH